MRSMRIGRHGEYSHRSHVLTASMLMEPNRSGSDHRTVLSSRRAPRIVEVRRSGRDGELRRQLLVEIDAQPRLFVGEHVAVLDLGAAHEHVLRLLGKAAAL